MMYILLLLCFLLLECRAEFLMTLVHHNDIHSHILPTEGGQDCEPEDFDRCFGGIARLATVVREAKSEPNFLHLNAGDMYQGTLWYPLLKYHPLIGFTNILGLHALALGNHDFDNGVEGLVPYVANISAPVIAANIDLRDEPTLKPYVKPYIVIDYNGTKVGVIGYITPDTEWLASPGNTIFYKEERFITKQVRNLYKEGVKIIVALGHSGYEKDKEIAERVPLIDIVVGGHSHTYLHAGNSTPIVKPEGPYPTVINQVTGRKVLVVQAYAFSKYLGKMLVNFDDEGELKDWSGKPILIEPGIPNDPEIVEEINKWLPKIQKETKEVISRSYVLLEGASEICRRRECSIGNLYTSSMLKKVAVPSHNSWTQIPAALLNAGATRVSLQPGDLSVSDLLQVHPFGNEVAVVTTKGDHLRRIIEHAVEFLDYNSKSEDPGAFLQMTGMRVKYDMCAVSGSRVLKLEILCQKCLVPVYGEVEDDEVYTLVMGDYMARDGDGFDILSHAIRIEHPGIKLNDMVREYITQASPIIMGNDGRVTLLRDGKDCSLPLIMNK